MLVDEILISYEKQECVKAIRNHKQCLKNFGLGTGMSLSLFGEVLANSLCRRVGAVGCQSVLERLSS